MPGRPANLAISWLRRSGVFEIDADNVRGLVEDCPAHMADSPGAHCCAEIGLGWAPGVWNSNRRGAWAELHIEYCAEHR